jgi:DNA-binding transcriptional MocR family regulator
MEAAKPAGNSGLPIDLGSLDMDPRLFPLEHFRSCLNRALKNHGPALFGYGDPAGFPPLREYIAHRLQSHGVAVTANEILITNGSQQAIDLVFRMIASPGRAIALESPTYSHMLPLVRYWGLKPLEIPIRDGGMDLSVLAEVIEKKHPALIYTMPNFQNPSGVCTSQAHREQLLSLCEKHHILILEDGFEEEMKYFGRVVLPIKSMDRRQIVVYCGTFSKVLFPGIRIGWIAAANECIARLTALRRFSELSPSMIIQAALHRFCQDGWFDRHIAKMHRVYRKRMQTATREMSRRIRTEWAEWTEPSGGFLIWLKLKPPSSRQPDWKTLLADHGVRVAPGNLFYVNQPPYPHLRLSISTLNEEEIVEGVRRLARAFAHAHSGRKS